MARSDPFDAIGAALRADAVGLFPGQGSITSGAGVAWRDSPHWDLIDRVSDVADVDVAAVLLSAAEPDVTRTDNAQLATFALALVGYAALRESGPAPAFHLGHSLGEFSALSAAGVLSLDDGARLIAARGRAMLRAARERDGSMVALMGGDDGAREATANLADVWTANRTSPCSTSRCRGWTGSRWRGRSRTHPPSSSC